MSQPQRLNSFTNANHVQVVKQQNRLKVQEVLNQMIQANEVWSIPVVAEKAGVSRSYFDNWDNRKLYNAARRKVLEVINPIAAITETFDPRKEGSQSTRMAPSVIEQKEANLAKLKSVLDKLIEGLITDPNQWTAQAITEKAGLSRNYLKRTNLDAYKMYAEAKRLVQSKTGCDLTYKPGNSYESDLEKLREVLDGMIQENCRDDSKWTYKSLGRAIGRSAAFFETRHPEARQMVADAKKIVFHP